MNKKNLIISATVLTAAVLVASIGTTVAWFTGSPYLEYNNISISIGDKNVEISDDNVDWYSSLDTDKLEKVDKFRPVSSMYSDQWLSRKELMPEFRNGYGLAATQFVTDDVLCPVADKDVGFFSQALYLKADADVTLTVDLEKTSFKADEKKNESVVDEIKINYPDLTEQEILDNLNSIQESLRMSILILNNEDTHLVPDYKYYIVDPYKKEETYFGGVMDINEDGFFDEVGGFEAVYGDLDNTHLAVYDEALNYSEPISGTPTVFNAKTMSNVRHFNRDASLENGMIIAKENSIALEDAKDEVLIPLTANVSRKIVVSFYLEGWDLDNTNVTMYSNFLINLTFMVTKNIQ